MTAYTLHYFNGRGRGEIIRLVFTYAGVKFEDHRIEFADWPNEKNKMPFGKVPVLEVHEGDHVFKLAQSMAIVRHLSRKFGNGLYGKNEIDAAFADMYADQLTDLQTEMSKVYYEKDEEKKKELIEKLQTEICPQNLAFFESRLASNSGHLASDCLTYADLYLYVMLEAMGDKKNEALEKFPNIRKLEESIRTEARIAEYLAKRPVTQM